LSQDIVPDYSLVCFVEDFMPHSCVCGELYILVSDGHHERYRLVEILVAYAAWILCTGDEADRKFWFCECLAFLRIAVTAETEEVVETV